MTAYLLSVLIVALALAGFIAAAVWPLEDRRADRGGFR